MDYEIRKNNIDDIKCIWFSTDYAGEKLCDKNFDCENCSFDEEMKNGRSQQDTQVIFQNSEQNLLEEIIHKLIALKYIKYPPHYSFNNCFVLKKFIGDTYFLGFNPVVNVLLDNVTSTGINVNKQTYKKGEKVFELEGEWGNVNVTAPFDFSFESEVLPVSVKPENGNWLGFIKSNNENIKSVSINRNDYLKSIDSICGNLKKFIKKHITVGVTMYDGGERLKYIYQLIGKENYLKILKQVLS